MPQKWGAIQEEVTHFSSSTLLYGVTFQKLLDGLIYDSSDGVAKLWMVVLHFTYLPVPRVRDARLHIDEPFVLSKVGREGCNTCHRHRRRSKSIVDDLLRSLHHRRTLYEVLTFVVLCCHNVRVCFLAREICLGNRGYSVGVVAMISSTRAA